MNDQIRTGPAQTGGRISFPAPAEMTAAQREVYDQIVSGPRGVLVGPLRAALHKALRKLPDLERLLARIHSFSKAHGSEKATHYADVGRARLTELIKTLEGLEALDDAVRAKCAGELPGPFSRCSLFGAEARPAFAFASAFCSETKLLVLFFTDIRVLGSIFFFLPFLRIIAIRFHHRIRFGRPANRIEVQRWPSEQADRFCRESDSIPGAFKRAAQHSSRRCIHSDSWPGYLLRVIIIIIIIAEMTEIYIRF